MYSVFKHNHIVKLLLKLVGRVFNGVSRVYRSAWYMNLL
jgi:hypothetical protein